MFPVLGLLLLLVTGCAAFRPRPRDPGLFLLPPSGAGFTRTLDQQITIHRDTNELEAMVVAEVTPSTDRLVALGPLGNRVLSLVWDGEHLEQERDPSLPKDFPVQLVLRDLQLAYWTPSSIRAALPSDWALTVEPHERTLSQAGEPVISIHFLGDPFKDPIEFEHRALKYRLTIKQVDEGR